MLKSARLWLGGYQWKWLVSPAIRRAIRKYVPGISNQDLAALGNQIFDITGGKVIAGPFEGMRYINEATGSAFCPKLLGTYEMELSEPIAAAIAADYDVLIDIGAAEGYYAVGMAYRCPKLRVLAFEQSETAQSLLRSLIVLHNAANRVEVRGNCTHAELSSSLGDGRRRALVICDIDGGELDLLNPDAAPELRRADILVELHDCFRPGLSDEIRHRFSPSHVIETLRSRPRRWWDCPLKGQLGRRRASIAVQEHRPGPQSWFWMKPR
jgi:hypothetical protein